MTTAHLDASHGITGEMLLGALVDAGAALDVVEAAVRTLGGGAVKMTWAHVVRGDQRAFSVRVRAPEDTPDVHRWEQVERLLQFVAVDDTVRDLALDVTRALFTAEAAVAGVELADLDLPPVGVLDAAANILGACAAIHDLGITTLDVAPIGVGEGTAETLVGDLELPAPAVRALLADFALVSRPADRELTTAPAAALLNVLGRPAAVTTVPVPARTGLGAGDRSTSVTAVVRLDLA